MVPLDPNGYRGEACVVPCLSLLEPVFVRPPPELAQRDRTLCSRREKFPTLSCASETNNVSRILPFDMKLFTALGTLLTLGGALLTKVRGESSTSSIWDGAPNVITSCDNFAGRVFDLEGTISFLRSIECKKRVVRVLCHMMGLGDRPCQLQQFE